MTVLAPFPVFKAWANDGFPLAFGKLFTYVAGTSTKIATYVDASQTQQNTNPIILNARGEANVWLDPTLTYKFVLAYPTDSDPPRNPIWTVDNIAGGVSVAALLAILTRQILGQIFYPLTPAESAANVIPIYYYYPEGDLRRYGADPTGVTDSSGAWQAAINVGTAFIPKNSRFLILTGATRASKTTVIGEGKTSQLLCDTTVLTVTNGTGSLLDNFYMENVTAPWIITRNPLNWAANVLGTLQQSNTVLGYQPTVNDTDVWGSLTPAQQNQQIGPTITCTGNATDIYVSRIFGRFVLINIMDARFSQIRDCDIIGGKGIWGALLFDNATNNTLQGLGNSAVGNTVRYSSFSGITFLNNNRGVIADNECLLNGESGLKPGAGPNNTTCNYCDITGNSCSDNYYDGIDATTDVPTDDAIAAYHNIVGNHCYRNGGDGINLSGTFNNCVGNFVHLNYRYGIWCVASLSNISDNVAFDNNQGRDPSTPEILGGHLNNKICNNFIWSGPTQNSPAIVAGNTHYIKGNYAIGSNFSFSSTSYLEGNIDPTTALVVEQSFIWGISNNAGTLQHTTYAQSGATTLGNFQSRIFNASATPTTTPTGADASTPMAAGWKIGSAATGNIWADTNDQLTNANAELMCSIAYNDTGTVCYVRPQIVSININGVTRFRLTFQFTKADGSSFVLNTTNIPSGKTIQVCFYGKLA